MADEHERDLGVVEAFMAVRDQCPSGAVRAMAERAIESARGGKAGVLREQAFYVLTAIQGWRGERATQVNRSLRAFLDS